VNALGQRVLPRLDLEGFRGRRRYRIAPPGLMLDGERVLVNHVLPGIVSAALHQRWQRARRRRQPLLVQGRSWSAA
jgi:hypothetical protein